MNVDCVRHSASLFVFRKWTDFNHVTDDNLYILVDYNVDKQTNMDSERRTGRLKALNLQPVSQHCIVWPPSVLKLFPAGCQQYLRLFVRFASQTIVCLLILILPVVRQTDREVIGLLHCIAIKCLSCNYLPISGKSS